MISIIGLTVLTVATSVAISQFLMWMIDHLARREAENRKEILEKIKQIAIEGHLTPEQVEQLYDLFLND